MGRELEDAIDGLYATFRAYRRPGSFAGCSCCWEGTPIEGGGGTVAVVSPGGNRPLRDLASDELAQIAHEVPTQGGTLELQKHYLPRVLEVAAGPGFGWPDLEVVLGRLHTSEELGGRPWTTWPEPERAAVARYLYALWLERLDRPGDDEAADATLCGIGRADPNIDAYLAAWLRFDRAHAADHVRRFLALNHRAMAGRRLVNAFWSDDRPPTPANRQAVLDWARSPATADAVVAAERAATGEQREALQAAYLLLPTRVTGR